MAKRSIDESNRDRVETEEGKVEEIPSLVDFDLPGPVVQQLVLLKDLTLIIRGSVSGNEYRFNGAGSIVDVDERDVEELLRKDSRRSCCGSDQPTPYFSLVGG